MHTAPRGAGRAAAVGITALVTVALAALLPGCLGDPAPKTCADYPPGTPGCTGDGDAAPPADGLTPDTGPAADAGPDGATADFAIADRGVTDQDPPGPPDAAELDTGPPDAALPGSPCEPNPCGAAPARVCLGDRVLVPSAARCLPRECPEGDRSCDPITLDCAALHACRLGCLFDRDFDTCTDDCVAAAPAAAQERYDAVNVCAEAADCPEDGAQFDCLRAACGDEIAACTGDPALIFYVRQRFPARGYVCDYPTEFGPDCSVDSLTCEGGACVESSDPCAGVDCSDVPPPRCAGDVVVTSLGAGQCEAEGGGGCVYPEERQLCPPGAVCDRGACVQAACPPSCDARVVVSCDAAGAIIRSPCERDAWCTDGACRPVPDIHGAACREAATIAACERAGLVCGGIAAVPICVLPDGPREVGETCFTAVDCGAGLLCTRAGRCSTGSIGNACLEDADCRNACSRQGFCT